MNTPAKAGVALAAIALAWVGATAYSGIRVKAELSSNAPFAGDGPLGLIKVTGSEYQKSFLGAKRVLELELGCAGEAPLRARWEDEIQHGPFPGFKSLGAARIASRLVLEPAERAKLKALIGSEELPMSLHTVVGLSGNLRSELSSPGFKLNAGDQQASVQLLPLTLVTERSGEQGKVRFDFQGYRVSEKAVQIEVLGIKGEGQGSGPLWWALGSGEASIERVAAQASGQAKPLFSLDKLHYSTSTQVDKELVQSSFDMKGVGEVGGHKLDAFRAKGSMKNLHLPSYQALMQEMMSTRSLCRSRADGAQDRQALLDQEMQAMKKLLAGFLPHKPEISIDEVSVGFGGETAKLSYAFGADGLSAADLETLAGPALLSKLRFSAQAETSVGFMQAVAKAQGQPPEMVDSMLQSGAARGFLVLEGKQIKAFFEMRDGMAKLNGKPVPLPGRPS